METLEELENSDVDLLVSGEVKGLRARGGYTVSIRWENGLLQEAVILPDNSGTCSIRYGETVKQITFKAGNAMKLTKDL